MNNTKSGSTGPDGIKGRHFGTAAIIFISLFLVLVVALHFLQPDTNPLTRPISEYIAGQYGWLLKVAFFGQGAAQILLAVGLYRLQNSHIHSLAGSILLTIAGLASFGSGIFDADPPGAAPTQNGMIHDQVGYIWFFAFLAAAFIYSRKIRTLNKTERALQALRYLPWLIIVMFIAMIFVFGLIFNAPGIGQRLVMATILSWIFLAARALQTGYLDFG